MCLKEKEDVAITCPPQHHTQISLYPSPRLTERVLIAEDSLDQLVSGSCGDHHLVSPFAYQVSDFLITLFYSTDLQFPWLMALNRVYSPSSPYRTRKRSIWRQSSPSAQWSWDHSCSAAIISLCSMCHDSEPFGLYINRFDLASGWFLNRLLNSSPKHLHLLHGLHPLYSQWVMRKLLPFLFVASTDLL